MNTKLLFLVLAISIIVIVPVVNAETTRTASTETTCTNGLCTKTLYSGSMFMEDMGGLVMVSGTVLVQYPSFGVLPWLGEPY